MKFTLADTYARIETGVNKVMGNSESRGIITYGLDNMYPQKMERIVLGSSTAVSVARILASFLNGDGFVNPALNDVVIGYDSGRKKVRLYDLLGQIANSISFYNGFYIYASYDSNGVINNTKLLPFKNCRLGKLDDTGYYSKIVYYPNGIGGKKQEGIEYNVFNPDLDVLELQGFNQQIFNGFLDKNYVYPLSVFDSVYLDCDSEMQLKLYRNNQIRNGFSKKTILNYIEPDNEDEQAELDKNLKNFASPTGSNFIAIPGVRDANTGEVLKDGMLTVTQLDSGIDDAHFDNWDDNFSTNIRMTAYGMPAILLDYEQNKLGSTSGQAFQDAVNIFNITTEKTRQEISSLLSSVYSNFDNTILKTADFAIKPITINTIDDGTTNI